MATSAEVAIVSTPNQNRVGRKVKGLQLGRHPIKDKMSGRRIGVQKTKTIKRKPLTKDQVLCMCVCVRVCVIYVCV